MKPLIVPHASAESVWRSADTRIDAFTPALPDLHASRHASVVAVSEAEIADLRAELEPRSVVALLPWRRCAVHLPDAATFYELRTARNRLLVTDAEQRRYREGSVAVAGLSVGFGVVQNIVLGGGPARLSIADFDTLSISNLNRLPHSICDLGTSKTDLAARRVYELDPFADVHTLDEGLNESNIRELLVPNGNPVRLFFEEMDQLPMKIASRRVARELGIPVVMVSDVGDGVLVDVERFDLEPHRPLFHGRVPEDRLDTTTPSERLGLVTAILGADAMTPRLQSSMVAVGKSLRGWPQLATAAAIAGAAGAWVARRILTGNDMPSGRYVVSLDEALDVQWSSADAVARRQAETRAFEAHLASGGR